MPKSGELELSSIAQDPPSVEAGEGSGEGGGEVVKKTKKRKGKKKADPKLGKYYFDKMSAEKTEGASESGVQRVEGRELRAERGRDVRNTFSWCFVDDS